MWAYVYSRIKCMVTQSRAINNATVCWTSSSMIAISPVSSSWEEEPKHTQFSQIEYRTNDNLSVCTRRWYVSWADNLALRPTVHIRKHLNHSQTFFFQQKTMLFYSILNFIISINPFERQCLFWILEQQFLFGLKRKNWSIKSIATKKS